MPNYTRAKIEGGSYFFTVALLERRGDLLVRHVESLRQAVRRVRAAKPFRINAWVVLPDHMHCVWTLPQGDSDYSTRWRDIKTVFSRSMPKGEYLDPTRRKTGERGIWQRRFWEHAIRNEADFWTHVNYVHLNPYKHGLVAHVRDWPFSSFHQYVRNGIYPIDWMTEAVDMDSGE